MNIPVIYTYKAISVKRQRQDGTIAEFAAVLVLREVSALGRLVSISFSDRRWLASDKRWHVDG